MDTIPDKADRHADPAYPVVLTAPLIRQLSGESLTIPALRHPIDLSIVERIAASFPPLAATDGWGVRFGRELNASDDRRHFVGGRSHLPVLEGKQLAPFSVSLDACRYWIPEPVVSKLLDPGRTFRRTRLAYRDVASATNRLTLIAALVPSGAVTTHSLFCLKTALHEDDQLFLCGILNSFVANYLVRLQVTTHVTAATVEALRAPKLPRESSLFREVRDLARVLAEQRSGSGPPYARLQALVATAYRLSRDEFRHILTTFPLVDDQDKRAALRMFSEG